MQNEQVFLFVLKAISESISAQTKVPIVRPFIINRSLFTLKNLAHFLNSDDAYPGELIRFCEANDFNSAANFRDSPNVTKLNIKGKEYEMYRLKVQGAEDAIKQLLPQISATGNRVNLLSTQLFLFAEETSELNLITTCLASIDEDILASFANVNFLWVKSIPPDMNPYLGFLPSFTNLHELMITLPNAENDFAIFECMSQLRIFYLSVDASAKNRVLTKKEISHLAKLPKLYGLSLSDFELNSMEHDTPSGFKELAHLQLGCSSIPHIHDEQEFQNPSTNWCYKRCFETSNSNGLTTLKVS